MAKMTSSIDLWTSVCLNISHHVMEAEVVEMVEAGRTCIIAPPSEDVTVWRQVNQKEVLYLLNRSINPKMNIILF